jgi:hypothetical protein
MEIGVGVSQTAMLVLGDISGRIGIVNQPDDVPERVVSVIGARSANSGDSSGLPDASPWSGAGRPAAECRLDTHLSPTGLVDGSIAPRSIRNPRPTRAASHPEAIFRRADHAATLKIAAVSYTVSKSTIASERCAHEGT